jgi:hypothetical protein
MGGIFDISKIKGLASTEAEEKIKKHGYNEILSQKRKLSRFIEIIIKNISYK